MAMPPSLAGNHALIYAPITEQDNYLYASRDDFSTGWADEAAGPRLADQIDQHRKAASQGTERPEGMSRLLDRVHCWPSLPTSLSTKRNWPGQGGDPSPRVSRP